MKVIILLVLVASDVFGTKLNPFSDEFINLINSKQSLWTAGRNFDENMSLEQMKRLIGSTSHDPTLTSANLFVHTADVDIPDSFDARQQWPECKDVIGTIVDQSNCGSCWAVAAASAMTDRRCIHSKAKLQVPVSALDILACCRLNADNSCQQGYPSDPWHYWYSNGIVTGGPFNSSEGCKSYPMLPCEHAFGTTRIPCTELHYDTPQCEKVCDDPTLSYKDQLTFAAEPTKWFNDVKSIQTEILLNGPAVATFTVYSDFFNYKSGVYKQIDGQYLGVHAIRIIGWGVDNDVPYWLIANSWNEDWGEHGYFRMLRGQDEVNIEQRIIASLPKI